MFWIECDPGGSLPWACILLFFNAVELFLIDQAHAKWMSTALRGVFNRKWMVSKLSSLLNPWLRGYSTSLFRHQSIFLSSYILKPTLFELRISTSSHPCLVTKIGMAGPICTSNLFTWQGRKNLYCIYYTKYCSAVDSNGEWDSLELEQLEQLVKSPLLCTQIKWWTAQSKTKASLMYLSMHCLSMLCCTFVCTAVFQGTSECGHKYQWPPTDVTSSTNITGPNFIHDQKTACSAFHCSAIVCIALLLFAMQCL